MTDALSLLRTAKAGADSTQADRDNYAAYIALMREYGWTDDDVSEYRTEVELIMKSGTDDGKCSAREFWAAMVKPPIEQAINRRIRQSIADERRKAA